MLLTIKLGISMQELSVEQLAVVRGDRMILRGLSFRVRSGEALHLCGANGAGKTSLLEILAGLRRSEEGTISGAPEPEQLHYLGVRNALSPALSPVDNLQFWCGINQIRPDGIETALKRLSVWTLRHRACRTLSTGQRRRVALARLLLATRPWWLLDEPFNGLDQAGDECFFGLLGAHLEQGGAAVIASHQPLASRLGNVRRLDLP
jgi:heme exporter protein A